MTCDVCKDLGFVLRASELSFIGVHEAVPCSACNWRRTRKRSALMLGCYVALAVLLVLFLTICAVAIATAL